MLQCSQEQSAPHGSDAECHRWSMPAESSVIGAAVQLLGTLTLMPDLQSETSVQLADVRHPSCALRVHHCSLQPGSCSSWFGTAPMHDAAASGCNAPWLQIVPADCTMWGVSRPGIHTSTEAAAARARGVLPPSTGVPAHRGDLPLCSCIWRIALTHICYPPNTPEAGKHPIHSDGGGMQGQQLDRLTHACVCNHCCGVLARG